MGIPVVDWQRGMAVVMNATARNTHGRSSWSRTNERLWRRVHHRFPAKNEVNSDNSNEC